MTLMPDPSIDPTAEAEPQLALAPVAHADPDKAVDEDEERRRKARANLMMRIAEHVDLPTVKESIGHVRKVARSERAHLSQLSDLVLNDVGLSSKLLRIINAAYYTTGGAGSITSMQRAVALMGFESVEMLAASLMLFERVPKGRDGEAVRDACSNALMSGWLAQQLCHSSRHVEAVYLPALFLNLGEMLVSLHAPVEARIIKKKVKDALGKSRRLDQPQQGDLAPATQAPTEPSRRQLHEATQWAARDVIGMTFEELGVEVARQWGWPEPLANQLRCLYADDASQEVEEHNYTRALCTAAADLAASLNALPVVGPEEELAMARQTCMRQFGDTWGTALNLDGDLLQSVGQWATEQQETIADYLDIAPPNANGERKTSRHGVAFQPKRPPVLNGPDRISKGLEHAYKGMQKSQELAAPMDELIEQLMVDLQEALRLQRIIVCLADTVQGGLRGVKGHGHRAPTVSSVFHVPLGGSQDLFSVLCANARDAIVSDAADPVIWKRLPSWFFQKVGARTFGVLPLTHRFQVRGMIYVDRQMANSLVLTDAELKQLQGVRDHLLRIMVEET